MSNLNSASTFILQPDIDSTSYIYANTGKPVPLSDKFLNVSYLTSENVEQTTGESGKLKTSIQKDTKNKEPLVRLNSSDATLIFLILLFSIVVYVRISGKNYINRIFLSIFNSSYSTSFFKEKNLAYTIYNNILLFIFYCSSGLIISILIDYFKFPTLFPNWWIRILFCSGITLFLMVTYRLLYRFFGVLFNAYQVVAEYLFFFSNSLKILGIAYVILLFGLFYTTATGKAICIYLTIFITIFVFLVKLYRILVIFFKNRFSLYYMILYFCALEIIPMILIVKIFYMLRTGEYSFLNILV